MRKKTYVYFYGKMTKNNWKLHINTVKQQKMYGLKKLYVVQNV